MTKTPKMRKAIDDVAKALFGRRPFEGACVTCGSLKIDPTQDFRDELSQREYAISGMCQVCQDSVFREID